ncbi:hypothetical protein [Bifidobacterium dentium]|uniref:hypothetical protein n=1 Tax=Bifidobacterium dentium TaxID=1689 RepID=UPI001F50CBDF|nr:hypothetical protein [Bifidobacterium dentium]
MHTHTGRLGRRHETINTHGRRPRGTDSISATPKGFRAYATVTDPLTGGDHRVSGFGRTRTLAENRLKDKLAEFDCTHRVGYVKPPTVAEWLDHWLDDICKSKLKSRIWDELRMDCGRLDDVTSTAIMGHSELTTVSQTGKTPSVQETGHSLPYLDAITNDFHITTSMKEHYL